MSIPLNESTLVTLLLFTAVLILQRVTVIVKVCCYLFFYKLLFICERTLRKNLSVIYKLTPSPLRDIFVAADITKIFRTEYISIFTIHLHSTKFYVLKYKQYIVNTVCFFIYTNYTSRRLCEEIRLLSFNID